MNTEIMDDIELTCPCCGETVILRWNIIHYDYGGSSPQFLGLERGNPNLSSSKAS